MCTVHICLLLRISGIELVNECVRGGGTGLMDALQAIGLTITRHSDLKTVPDLYKKFISNIQTYFKRN